VILFDHLAAEVIRTTKQYLLHHSDAPPAAKRVGQSIATETVMYI